MAKKTVGKKTAARSTKKTAAAKPKANAESVAAANAAKAAAEAKREAREAQTAEQMDYVVKHYVNGDEKLAAVAKHLKITSGKAAFLAMQHRVAEGQVPAIKGKDDEALLANINAARLKADKFSSWGWLAARSGRSEGFIKTGLEAAGLFKPHAENIASKRAAAKPKVAKKTSTAKKGGKKKVSGNA